VVDHLGADVFLVTNPAELNAENLAHFGDSVVGTFAEPQRSVEEDQARITAGGGNWSEHVAKGGFWSSLVSRLSSLVSCLSSLVSCLLPFFFHSRYNNCD
jgi:hypothetical protein